MPQPYAFESKQKLIAELSKHKTTWWDLYEPIRRDIKKKHAGLSIDAIVKASVGPNTYRALSGKPSQVFRKWGTHEFTQRIDKFREVTSQSEFDNWLGGIVASLQQEWWRKTGKRLAFGPSLKLPNLVAKHLCICDEISPDDGKRVARYLHIPLDSFTIVGLKNCTSDVFPARWKIRNTSAMGFIDEPERYWAFQYRIRELASSADVPPIVFDFLCWNESHP